MSTDLPDPLVRYLEQRDADRTAAVAATLARLTDRERALVKDAAVMGYVLGTQHPRDEPVPRDSTMVAEVVGACLADPDLFPDLGAPDDQQDGPAEPRHDTQDATPEAHATGETREAQNDAQRAAQPFGDIRDAHRRAELADAVTAETKRLLTRRTTTLRNRAERAEARAEQAEAALQGVRSMAQAWLRVMPPTVATKTAANAVLQRTAEYAHLDGTDTPEEH